MSGTQTLGRALRAEVTKLTTVRLWWGLAIGVVVWVGLQAGAGAGLAGSQESPGLDTTAGLGAVWQSATQASVFTLVLGVLMITGEMRHQTATSTFLALPGRSVVIVAKALVVALAGAGYAVLGILVTFAVGLPIVAARGFDPFDAPGVDLNVPGILLGTVVGGALWGAIAVGFGALVRSQVLALVGALAWVLLVESLAVAFLPVVGRWLPGGAANALVSSVPMRGGDLLPPVAATFVLIGYAVLLVLLGAWQVRRRDVV